MLKDIFKKEKDPEKEKERVFWSTLISGTLFLLGVILVAVISCAKK